MERAKKIIMMVFIMLLCAPLLFALDLNPLQTDTVLNAPPSPKLIYPTTETVVLTGKSYLEFKWDINDFTRSYDFDFRLYRGYEINDSNLISKEILPYDKRSIEVKAVIFKDDQVYTWTIRRTALGGAKSGRSFSSFRVIKK